MKLHIDWRKVLPYIVAVALFLGFAIAYCSPILEGKVLQAGDVNNWKGAAHEAQEFLAHEGHSPWWTNSMFGGMPTYQITGSLPSGELRSTMEKISHFGFWDNLAPIGMIMGYLFGFFIMLICFGINPWLSIVGAFALTLSTYFMLIIPAGHATKVSALAALAPVIGGVYAIFRKRYLLGAPIMVLYGIIGITLHPQMTYYMVMLMGVMGCAELYIHIREKRWKDLGISLAVLTGCALLIFGTKLSWWQMNNNYLKETMRGGHSELTQIAQAGDDASKRAGLDIEYATAWSYGKAETLTLLIPNYMGGCSGYDLGKDSQLEKDLKKMGIPARQAKGFCQGAPTYWGEKAFTSGPVYVGAIVCMLFVLGLLLVHGPYKWALLIATIFSIMLAWGRNLMPFTELFFNYFPMYNKFRAVESILVVAEITIPLLGFLGLKELVSLEDKKRGRLMVIIAGGVTAAICLFVAVFGGSFDVTSSYDDQWKGQVGQQIYNIILDQRHQMMTSSAWRSLLFVLLGTATLLLYLWKKETKNSTLILASMLGMWILIDMVPVNLHFFNKSNFVTTKDDARYFAIQPWEEQILQDKSLDYRVFNMAANTFNDARTSYRLKSIGGYSAAKLRRYQDLIDAHITQNNWAVIDMLNTKYIITRDGQVHLNPNAMGNAWFVNDVKFVDTPDEESEALRTLDLHTTAVADKKFAEVLDITKPAVSPLMAYSEEYIRMTSYAPNRLEYDFQAEQNKLVVFSEIYYPEGWHLYVDDKEYPIGRANYVLRAAVIPAGTHKICMEFVPNALKTDKLCMGLIILAILLSIVVLSYPLWKKNEA
ncbi:MAG: YfhO family protein [Paludibacteraceae bacterium]